MNIAIYPRKSKKDDNSESMEQQIDDCKGWKNQCSCYYEIRSYSKKYARFLQPLSRHGKRRMQFDISKSADRYFHAIRKELHVPDGKHGRIRMGGYI